MTPDQSLPIFSPVNLPPAAMAEWSSCSDLWSRQMFLRRIASVRQCRLFGAACCRSLWHHLVDDRSRRAVEVAERFADGEATLAQLRESRVAAFYAAREFKTEAHRAVHYLVADEADVAASRASDCASRSGLHQCQYLLLQDILSPPASIRRIQSSVLEWNGGTVRKVAASVYAERRFEEMPVLADALEEAGCDNTEILTHLRSAGPHVLGCWALDLLLGRK